MHQRKNRRWQFSIGTLLVVTTVICIRLGLESQGWGWRARRHVVIRINVDRPMAPDEAKTLQRKLQEIEGVTLVSIRPEPVISVHARKNTTQTILDAIREHGLKVERYHYGG